MLIEMGHEFGLFDSLEALEETTCPAFALCVGMNEHYLGEWLYAMVNLGQVEFDAGTRRFAIAGWRPRPRRADFTNAMD